MESERKPRLMDRVKRVLRVQHYSIRTEKTCCYWIRYFIRYSDMRHPATMGAGEVRAFLDHLAVERNLAAASQNQALNALVFLYRKVLDQPLGDIGEGTPVAAIAVRSGKGNKDRVTLLPASLDEPLHERIEQVRRELQGEPTQQRAPVTQPHALARTYPDAGITLAWHREVLAAGSRMTGQSRSPTIRALSPFPR